jgi:hypothetical protein
MAEELNASQKRAVQERKDTKESAASDKAYKKSTVYPDTEDVVTKEAPITGPIGRYATDRLFGKDVPFTERAKGAAALVPAAAAIQAEKGIRYLGKKLSGDKEQGKKAGGTIKKMVRGGGIESRGKTKGRFV